MKQRNLKTHRMLSLILCFLMVFMLLPVTAFAESETSVHTHTWAETWATDDTHHWHECVADGCTITDNADKEGYGEHVYDDDADAFCNICGDEREIVPIEDADITFQLPFTTTVVQTGAVAPESMAFQYEMSDFGSETAIEGMNILNNTVMTEGTGTFEGMLRFTVKESHV